MKKFVALAFALGALTTVFGQNGYPKNDRDESGDITFHRSDNPDEPYGNRHPNRDSYSFKNARERDAQIARINREFDFRIMAVKRDHYLRHGEKKRQIRNLERARKEQIKQVSQRYSNWKGSNHRNYNKRDRY